MKKTIISLALAFLGIANLYAVKAKPGIAKIMLADGTVACATLHGDETFHYYMLLDGTPLRETQDGKYEKITAEELNTRKTRAFSSANLTRASEIGTVSPSYFPHKGSPKALVLLVQFQDVKFKSKDPVATFNHYLNGKKGEAMPEADKEVFITNENYCQNYGSVQQYFADMSDNQFIPQFDVVGPVTVSKNSAYYGKNGVDDGSDTNYPQMIKEACQQVNAKVNFADYDSDGDGYVDLVYVIYAGYSESISGNSSDCLWPKSGTVGGLGTYDRKTVSRFGINNEPSTLSGKVTYNKVPVMGAKVQLKSSEVSYEETTNAAGEYKIDVSRSDLKYVLTVSAAGYPTYTEANPIEVIDKVVKDIELTNATGINSIFADDNDNSDVQLYNLSGQKVQNTGRGIYIVKGKKYVVK